MGNSDLLIGVGIGLMLVSLIFLTMHDRHYQSRGNMILLNRVETLEKIVSEWTN